MHQTLFDLNFRAVNRRDLAENAIVYLISYGENSYKTFVGVTYENINEAINIVAALNNYGEDHLITSLIFMNGNVGVEDLNIQCDSLSSNLFSHYWQNVLKDILFTDGFKEKIRHFMLCNPTTKLLYDVDDLDNAYHIIENSGNKHLKDNDAPF